MEHRFAVLNEGSRPKVFKVLFNQTARLVNEFPDRKVEIFETLNDARNVALALVGRAEANAKPKFAMFAVQPNPEDQELRRMLSELTEDRVERYNF